LKITANIILVLLSSILFSQSFTESDIKNLAKQVNDELIGVDIGNGVTVRGCIAYGRTLAYQYDVSPDWYATPNMKDDLIANFKEGEISEIYYDNDINIDFYYFLGNRLQKKISIKSREFSNLNFILGEYINIKGHPKSKGVNLKIKQPVGWELKEGDRPNVIKKFVYKTNTYLILIKNNMMFFSRKETLELLHDEEYVNEFIAESSSFLKDNEIINHNVITIDKYPSLEFTFKGKTERMGSEIKMIMKNWVIFYEDKIIFLQCIGGDNKDFYTLERFYNSITNSIIFPDQYN